MSYSLFKVLYVSKELFFQKQNVFFSFFSCHPWAELIRPHLPNNTFDETDTRVRSDNGLRSDNVLRNNNEVRSEHGLRSDNGLRPDTGLRSNTEVRSDTELRSDTGLRTEESIFSTSCILLGRHVDVLVDKHLSLKCQRNPKQDLLRYQSVQFRRPL